VKELITQIKKSLSFSDEEKREIIERLKRIQKTGKYLAFADTLEGLFAWREVEGGHKYWWEINQRLNDE
jgi:hypothetical protein